MKHLDKLVLDQQLSRNKTHNSQPRNIEDKEWKDANQEMRRWQIAEANTLYFKFSTPTTLVKHIRVLG